MSLNRSNTTDEFTGYLQKLFELKEKYPDCMDISFVGGFLTFIILKIPTAVMGIVNKAESLLMNILGWLQKEGKSFINLVVQIFGKRVFGVDFKRLNPALVD